MEKQFNFSLMPNQLSLHLLIALAITNFLLIYITDSLLPSPLSTVKSSPSSPAATLFIPVKTAIYGNNCATLSPDLPLPSPDLLLPSQDLHTYAMFDRHCFFISKTANEELSFTGSRESSYGVRIRHPNLYVDDNFVVHGVDGVHNPSTASKCFGSKPTVKIKPLQNSSFVAMSLILDLIPPSLFSDRRSVTIFAAPDEAFASSHQPSLSLLEYHCSPLAFSFESLRSLPYGTKIPTMSFQLSLIVTTTNSKENISINNVTVTGSPLYDDGSLMVFAIKQFFDPTFTVSSSIPSPRPDFGCLKSTNGKTISGASYGTMKSFGLSAMAAFLDLQLPGYHEQTNLTVFAPDDDAMSVYAGNFFEYSSLFLRHVLPCKLTWTELTSLNGEKFTVEAK